jgi:hypothetical protein
MSKKNKARPAVRASASPVTGAVRTGDFNPDYSVTKRELRRIGILAGVILVILVILAIFQEPILALILK